MTGGAAVGVTAGVTGIGSAAVKAASTTLGQYIGVGAASGAVGGTAFSLATDADRKFVDGADVTMKQVLGHALAGAAIGCVAGVATGAVAGSVSGITAEVSAAEVSSTNLEARVVPGVRRLAVAMAKSVSRGVTDKSTESILGSVTSFIEERIDEEQENRPVGEHIKDAGVKLVSGVVLEACQSIGSSTVSHVMNETSVYSKLRNDADADYDNMTPQENRLTRQKVRYELDSQNRASFVKWNEYNGKAKYCPPNKHASVNGSTQFTHQANESSAQLFARFRYITDGKWCSKMIVKYKLDGEGQKAKETSGSGTSVEIPIQAKEVKISFQVLRFIGTWCDVQKWDRFRKVWHPEATFFRTNAHLNKEPSSLEDHFTLNVSCMLSMKGTNTSISNNIMFEVFVHTLHSIYKTRPQHPVSRHKELYYKYNNAL